MKEIDIRDIIDSIYAIEFKHRAVGSYQMADEMKKIKESVIEAVQALQQQEKKPITKEEIEYRIKEEYKKHRNSSILVGDEFHWAKIASSKIYALITN